MHEHAGTAAVEGEQKKRREEGAGAARVVSNVCPGGRQPSRENAHLCLSPLPSVAARDRFALATLGLSESASRLPRLTHSLSLLTRQPARWAPRSASLQARSSRVASRPARRRLGGRGDLALARPARACWGCGGAY